MYAQSHAVEEKRIVTIDFIMLGLRTIVNGLVAGGGAGRPSQLPSGLEIFIPISIIWALCPLFELFCYFTYSSMYTYFGPALYMLVHTPPSSALVPIAPCILYMLYVFVHILKCKPYSSCCTFKKVVRPCVSVDLFHYLPTHTFPLFSYN